MSSTPFTQADSKNPSVPLRSKKDSQKRLRKDFQLIEACIPHRAKVLDLGCGDGSLLQYLQRQKSVTARGIEMDLESVRRCLQKKISIYHGNIEDGLAYFPKRFFDVIVLSRTIHRIWNLDTILPSLFRVGKQVIVTFMNYSYYRNRFQFFFKGINPKSMALPYEWYETPNIRFLSILDFEVYCQKNKIKVIKRFFYKHNWSRPCVFMPNLFAECSIYVLQKEH